MIKVQELVEKLRKTVADNLRVRVGVLLVVLAITGWQFLPVWVRFAIVLYTGAPIAGTVLLAGAVGWLTWNRKHCLEMGAWALGCLLLVSVIAIDKSEARCTGYVEYGLDRIGMVLWGAFASTTDGYAAEDARRHKDGDAADADYIFKYQLCFTLAEWRASWR
jgi:hypothetical protein